MQRISIHFRSLKKLRQKRKLLRMLLRKHNHPPMQITYMGNNSFGAIEMTYIENQRLVNNQFKDINNTTQYQINPILKNEESNCCSEFCCCDNEKPKPKKKGQRMWMFRHSLRKICVLPKRKQLRVLIQPHRKLRM